MTVPQQATGDGNRKRRAHKKSRLGCGNCKLRSVKCDETKPKCLNCTGYGVSCNYDAKASDLQLCFDGIATITTPQIPPPSSNRAAISRIEVPASLYYPTIVQDKDSSILLDSQSLDRLTRFQKRTVLSIGSRRVAHLFQNISVELAFAHPYVMHVVQTITATHDRYLSSTPQPRQTVTEVYHLSRAAALFNQKLSAPLAPHDRDSLWATAAMLSIVAMSWIDATCPEEAWPLRPAEPSDLEWQRMAESKATIWTLTNPLRPDSIFHVLIDDYKSDYFVSHKMVPCSGVEGIPEVFVKLYGLDKSSMSASSPYFAALHVVVSLLNVECDQSTIVRFLSFISQMGVGFKQLLECKDPRALLLMAYWYAKVCHTVWWLDWRAIMECRATCLYLERYHADETAVLELLPYPKMRCGLLVDQVM